MSSGGSEPSRWRGLAFGVTAATLCFALGVGAVEAALWLFAPVRYHEWLIWIPDGHIRGRPLPGQVIHTAAGHSVRINDLGFRGDDWEWTPAPGTLRIVALGGSSTFNFHAAGEQNTWPELLEARLSADLEMPVEVLNLGLPGFNASTSRINYVFTARPLHPHVAVMYHTWNDLKLFRRLEDGPQVFARTAPNKPLWQRIARATQIGRYARNALHELALTESESRYTSLEREGARAHQPADPRAFAWFRQSFADFIRLARADSVLPVVVSQGTLVRTETIRDPEVRRQILYDAVGMTLPVLDRTWSEASQVIEEVAREEGALFADGYGAIPADFEHFVDHVHMTDRGLHRLADELARVLLADTEFRQLAERVRSEGARGSADPAQPSTRSSSRSTPAAPIQDPTPRAR